jgi:RNA polymerase sigma-70 factor (ECF subfamily)
MVNTALEILRKKDILRNSVELTSPNQHHGGLREGLHTEPVGEDENDGSFAHISAAILHQTISEMPVGFRTVFNLYAVENYTHKEIARLTGISEGTSKSQFARARAWLQKRLNEKTRIKHAGQ